MSSSPNSQMQKVAFRPGLCVLRYHQAGTHKSPPVINLESPRDRTDLQTLPEPGATPWQLDRIGQCMVLAVTKPCNAILHITPRDVVTPKEVVVKLEYLTSDAAPQAADDAVRPADIASKEEPRLRLFGHVSRIGDCKAEAGEWIAGPTRPLPIEGLQASFLDGAQDLQLHIAASANGAKLSEAHAQEMGNFVGSRGCNRPLTGVRLELVGARAAAFRLDVEAMFFGAPLLSRQGRVVNLHGPSGREALLGLRVNISRDSGINNSLEARTDTSAPRVLVFK